MVDPLGDIFPNKEPEKPGSPFFKNNYSPTPEIPAPSGFPANPVYSHLTEAQKRVFDSGKTDGFKMDLGKTRFGLLPTLPLEYVARVYTMGAKKYSDHNWRKGMAWSRVYDAMLRHLNKYWGGEVIDPESGLPHLAHVVFGCFSLMEYQQTHPELDDRDKEGSTK